MYERKQFEEIPKQDRINNHASIQGVLDLLTQAQISSEKVTGDPDWDRYLSYLQAAVERTRMHRERYSDVLSDPKVTDQAAMMAAKIGLLECDAQIKAWDAAISLPVFIKVKHGEITEWLNQIGLSPSDEKTKS